MPQVSSPAQVVYDTADAEMNVTYGNTGTLPTTGDYYTFVAYGRMGDTVDVSEDGGSTWYEVTCNQPSPEVVAGARIKATDGSVRVKYTSFTLNTLKTATGRKFQAPVSGASIGVIATGTRFPNASGGGNLQSMTRKRHTLLDRASSIQLVYSNTILASTSETPASQASTVTASIEYPVGTIIPVTFGGAKTGTVPISGALVSDPISLPDTLPAGTVLFSRTFQNAPGGIVYVNGAGTNAGTGAVSPNGEFFAFGATTTDLTASTATANNALANTYYGPQAIIGLTSKPTFFLIADSRVLGINGNGEAAGAQNQWGAVGTVERCIAGRYGYVSGALGGEKAQDVAGAAYVTRSIYMQWCRYIINEAGINDNIAGASASTLMGYQTTIASKFGKPMLLCTLEPRTTSSDGWATTANQTVNGQNSARVAYNEMLRTGLPAPFAGYFEIADVFESQRNSGLWRPAIRLATDISITSGTAVVASTSAMQFSTADVGQAILIMGAGSAGAMLSSYILSVQSPTSATIRTNASTTVASGGTAVMPYCYDGLHSSKLANLLLEQSTTFAGLTLLT